MTYIWERKEWPRFAWDESAVEKNAEDALRTLSSLVVEADNLPKEMREKKAVDFMVSEGIKTSEIEGEFYKRSDVRGSINRLLMGLPPPDDVEDKNAIGISNLMVDCRRRYMHPLTVEQICQWQKMVVSGAKYNRRVDIGRLRSGGINVYSPVPGGIRIHYEGPPPERVPEAMDRFTQWFNISSVRLNSIIRAGVSHIYFESIHPFDDGNGRVGRAIIDVALSQGLGCPAPLSMSSAIMRRRDEYNDKLESASRGNLDITDWLLWFVDTTQAAQAQAIKGIRWALFKFNVLDRHDDEINDRQAAVLGRLFRDKNVFSSEGFGVEQYMDMANCGETEARKEMRGLRVLGVFDDLENTVQAWRTKESPERGGEGR